MERMRLTREQWLHELQVRAMEYENICVSCWAQWLETFLSRQAPTVSHVHYFFYMGLRLTTTSIHVSSHSHCCLHPWLQGRL